MTLRKLTLFMIAFLLVHEGAADVVHPKPEDDLRPMPNFETKKELEEIHPEVEKVGVMESGLPPESEDYLAPMTNYATKEELRKKHRDALKVGQTKVQTKLNNIDVTVWTEPHSLPSDFCKPKSLKIVDFIELLTPGDLVQIIDHFKDELPPPAIKKILQIIPKESFIPQQPHLYTKENGTFIPFQPDPDSPPKPGIPLYTKQEAKLIPFDPNTPSPTPLPPHLYTKQEAKFIPFDPNSRLPGPSPPRLYKNEQGKFIPFDPNSPPSAGPTPSRLYTKQEEKIIPFNPESPSPEPLPPQLFTKQEAKFIPLTNESNPCIDQKIHEIRKDYIEQKMICPPTDEAKECKDPIILLDINPDVIIKTNVLNFRKLFIKNQRKKKKNKNKKQQKMIRIGKK